LCLAIQTVARDYKEGRKYKNGEVRKIGQDKIGKWNKEGKID